MNPEWCSPDPDPTFKVVPDLAPLNQANQIIGVRKGTSVYDF